MITYGQGSNNLRYLFGMIIIDYHPTVVYFKNFLGVHQGTSASTHGHRPRPRRQRRLAVTRSILATNDCELPVEAAFAESLSKKDVSAYANRLEICMNTSSYRISMWM